MVESCGKVTLYQDVMLERDGVWLLARWAQCARKRGQSTAHPVTRWRSAAVVVAMKSSSSVDRSGIGLVRCQP